MLTAIDHVVLAVRDLPDAGARFSRLLARTPSWVGEHPGNGTANQLYSRAKLDVTRLLGGPPSADVLRSLYAQVGRYVRDVVAGRTTDRLRVDLRSLSTFGGRTITTALTYGLDGPPAADRGTGQTR